MLLIVSWEWTRHHKMVVILLILILMVLLLGSERVLALLAALLENFVCFVQIAVLLFIIVMVIEHFSGSG